MRRYVSSSMLVRSLGFILVGMLSFSAGALRANAVLMKPKTVLVGHKKRVYALTFSPDGRTLATASSIEKSTARLWDVITGRMQTELIGIDGGASFLACSPDGQVLATGSVKTVSLWDMASGQLKTNLERRPFVFSIGFSPDSTAIGVAGSDYKPPKVYDVTTGQMIATLSFPEGVENMPVIAYSSDGRTIATISTFTSDVYLWDAATLRIRATLRGHGSTIYQIRFSPDGRTLASASRDATAKLWDVQTGQLKATLTGHKQRVHRLAFSPDGHTLATGSYDKTAKLWDVATGQLRSTLTDGRESVDALSFSADGRLLAVGGEKAVMIWDVVTGQNKATLMEARWPVAFSPSGRLLATGGQGATVLLWDIP